MRGPFTSYATDRTWAQATPTVDLAPPAYCAPPPAFLAFSEFAVGESFSFFELITPGATRFVDRQTNRRLLDESITQYRDLWTSLARK